MNITARNGEETWRTSETYKRRAGAYKALLSAFDDMREAAGLPKMEKVTIAYTDHTRKKP